MREIEKFKLEIKKILVLTSPVAINDPQKYFYTNLKPQQNKGISIEKKAERSSFKAFLILKKASKDTRRLISDKLLRQMMYDLILDLKFVSSNNLNHEINISVNDLFQRAKAPGRDFVVIIPLRNIEIQQQVSLGQCMIFRLNQASFAALESEFQGSPLIFPGEEWSEIIVRNNGTDIFAKVKVNASDGMMAEEIAFETIERTLSVPRMIVPKGCFLASRNLLENMQEFIISYDSATNTWTSNNSNPNRVVGTPTLNEVMDKLGSARQTSLDQILSLKHDQLNSLQEGLLDAIFWFGTVINDPLPTSRYVKCVIALESLLLLGERNKKRTIAKRFASVVYKNDEDRLKKEVYSQMMSLYEIRNDIIHNGLNGVEKEDLDQLENWTFTLLWDLIPFGMRYGDIKQVLQNSFPVNDRLYQPNTLFDQIIHIVSTVGRFVRGRIGN